MTLGPTPTVTVDPGGGGEPHFVGFDGTRFDYHGTPKQWYLLWQSESVTVKGFFDMEPIAAMSKLFGGTTFITKIAVEMKEKKPMFFHCYEDWSKRKKNLKIEEKTGLIRGLPPQLQFITGDVIGYETIEFEETILTVSCMNLHLPPLCINFLNLSFKVKKKTKQETGILGQTLKNKKDRQENDSFIIEGYDDFPEPTRYFRPHSKNGGIVYGDLFM